MHAQSLMHCFTAVACKIKKPANLFSKLGRNKVCRNATHAKWDHRWADNRDYVLGENEEKARTIRCWLLRGNRSEFFWVELFAVFHKQPKVWSLRSQSQIIGFWNDFLDDGLSYLHTWKCDFVSKMSFEHREWQSQNIVLEETLKNVIQIKFTRLFWTVYSNRISIGCVWSQSWFF